MHGPTCMFWANLTAFSLPARGGGGGQLFLARYLRSGRECRAHLPLGVVADLLHASRRVHRAHGARAHALAVAGASSPRVVLVGDLLHAGKRSGQVPPMQNVSAGAKSRRCKMLCCSNLTGCAPAGRESQAVGLPLRRGTGRLPQRAGRRYGLGHHLALHDRRGDGGGRQRAGPRDDLRRGAPSHDPVMPFSCRPLFFIRGYPYKVEPPA